MVCALSALYYFEKLSGSFLPLWFWILMNQVQDMWLYLGSQMLGRVHLQIKW